jgi:hypothetical protein
LEARVKLVAAVLALITEARTGYLYGTIEETARVRKTAAALSTREACDPVRLTINR